jgi:hypothetical protein
LRADGRDRTGDNRFTRAVLYQLSYVGECPIVRSDQSRTAETARSSEPWPFEA